MTVGSNVMGWFRRRLRFLGGVANAVSHAETGPYAGAPRDPELRIGDEKSYSTIEHQTTHVTVAAAIERLDGDRTEDQDIVLEPYLVVRKSTAKAQQ